MPQTIITN